MVEPRQRRRERGVAAPALEREGALSRRRRALREREDLGVVDGESEPAEPGEREHSRVVATVAHLPEARLDVPADLARRDAGRERAQEGRSPRARGPDDGVRRKRREAAALARDEDVARVLAFRDRGDHEVLALRRREILQGVDGDVDLAVRERALDRVDEDAVAQRAERGGGRVARRPDHAQLDGAVEPVRHDPCLRESECAAAGPDDDAHGADTFRERATARNGCGEVCRNSGSLRP